MRGALWTMQHEETRVGFGTEARHATWRNSHCSEATMLQQVLIFDLWKCMILLLLSLSFNANLQLLCTGRGAVL